MSVLYTITAYPPSIGGAQLHMHEFARRIAQQTSVGVMYHWNNNRTDWLFGSTLNAPYHDNGAGHLDGVNTYQLSLNAEQRDRVRFWVYTYQLLQDAALDRISSAFFENMRRKMPMILKHPPDIIHNSRVGREGLTFASLRYARSLGVPFVFTPNHHHHWRGWLYRHYLSVYREADAVIAHTNYEREALIQLGVRPERVHVIGIGPVLATSWHGGRFRSRFNIPFEAPLILYLGQKYAYKRFSLILDSMPQVWQHYPNARFVFIGPRTSDSQRIFRRVSDPRVVEMDTVDLQLKTDALAACDMLVMPSSKESFGGVYVEAWMMGKPVIGGDAPAVREVIDDGKTGFTVGGDVDLLANKILTLLGDPKCAAEMGAAGRRVAENYDWRKLTDALCRVYTGLTS